jgi:mannose-6-phosphate isomerase-like protein (cupin superfamily)
MTTFVTLPYVMEPGAGLEAPLGHLGTVHKVPAYVTEGRVAAVEHTLPPKHLAAPLHRHSREDEVTIVLSGTLGAKLGDDVVHATTGAYVLKPRGQWHTFWNAGDSELHCIELLIPGGLDAYFQWLSTLLHASQPPNRAAIETLAAEYGLDFDFESVPALCKEFELTFPEVCAAGDEGPAPHHPIPG